MANGMPKVPCMALSQAFAELRCKHQKGHHKLARLPRQVAKTINPAPAMHVVVLVLGT